MKKQMILSALLFGAAFQVQAANLLYEQDFETPIDENPEISWTTGDRPVSQAVVENAPKSGDKSVRGNFNSDIVDPITGLSGVANTHFDIQLDKVESLKDWLLSTDTIYVSWWFKLDQCLWKGREFSNSDSLKVKAKFAYLNMNNDPTTSYYLSINGGNNGSGILQTNSSSWMSDWQDWYGKASLWTGTDAPFGSDGQWHKLAFLIDRDENGNKRFQWWIDDYLMRADSLEENGKFRISNEYIFDTIGFWHTGQKFIDESEKLVSDNHCNGWQIDLLQVWDDVPARPMPPVVNN